MSKDNTENKYTNRRYLFGFLSIIPGAIGLLMGCFMWVTSLPGFLYHKGDYKAGDFKPSPNVRVNNRPNGVYSIGGYVNGVETTLSFGQRKTARPPVHDIPPDTTRAEEIYPVWYRPDGVDTLHRTGRGFDADFRSSVFRILMFGCLFVLPFFICMLLHVYYENKENKLKRSLKRRQPPAAPEPQGIGH